MVWRPPGAVSLVHRASGLGGRAVVKTAGADRLSVLAECLSDAGRRGKVTRHVQFVRG